MIDSLLKDENSAVYRGDATDATVQGTGVTKRNPCYNIVITRGAVMIHFRAVTHSKPGAKEIINMKVNEMCCADK